MKTIKIIALLMLCTGCTQMTDAGQKANGAMRRGIYNTAGKVQELTRYNPPPTQPQSPQVGYCYNTMSDIVCYEIPQPQLSNKLVGYQGMAPADPRLLPPPSQEIQVLTSDQVMSQGSGRATPFYIKEAPYVKADGEVVTSSKIMPIMPPSGGMNVAPPMDNTSAGGPARLMPRY